MPYAYRQPDSAYNSGLPGAGLWFDASNTAISLAYDLKNRGILIALTPNTAGSTSGTHWWYDLETKSFWKMVFGTANQEPFCLHARRNFIAESAAHSTVMWGGRNGYVYRLQNTENDDDGNSFTSYVWFGPFGDPSLYSETVITEIVGVMAKHSGEVKWSLHKGDTPEEAFAADAIEEGTWTAGRNNAQHPRVRGQSVYLKITSTDSTGWGFEAATMILKRAGKVRP